MFNSNKFYNIQQSFDLKKNAHSYIFYTNDFLKCKNDLELLIKYIFKNDNLTSLENDYVVIKKSENKEIKKEEVLDLKRIFFNTSYVNDYRVYVIEEVHKLNPVSANMILKFLEEPTERVVAFFITTNLDSVMSTIKSRCQIINIHYDFENNYIEEDLKIVDDILKLNRNIALFNAKNQFKKYDRNKLIELFNNYVNYLYEDMINKEKIKLIKKFNKCIKMLNNNVNIDYIFDILFLEGE